MLYSLIYISKARKPLTIAQLVGLLEQARISNSGAGITGMLLYIQRNTAGQHEGRFMQALEGPKDVVLRIFNKISADGRHEDVLLISEDDIHQRSFDAWSMGFKALKPEDLKAIPGYLNLKNDAMLNRLLKGISKPLNYLRSFYQINQELNY